MDFHFAVSQNVSEQHNPLLVTWNLAQVGLLAAMDSMKNELMLLGFATLLLLTFEQDILRICGALSSQKSLPVGVGTSLHMSSHTMHTDGMPLHSVVLFCINV